MKERIKHTIETGKRKIMSLSTFAIMALSALVVVGGVIIALDFVKPDGCLDGGSFINPRFACGEEFVISKGEYKTLRTDLVNYIRSKKEFQELSDISIYFRDLESGPTMGINERQDFIPASLLKLPLAITYYSMNEEEGDGILKRTLAYNNDTHIPQQTFHPQEVIEKGTTYTVSKLIEHMIVYSDNLAAQALFENLIAIRGMDRLSQTYRDLGIIDAGSNLELEAVNAKGYASIFRQLYNSSFLSPEDSEELLSYLADSKFTEGLAAGVPEGVVVAHKFGERYLEDGTKRLHDCGIVYYTDNPYVLCILTKGPDFEELQEIIQTISTKVYQEVDSRRIN